MLLEYFILIGSWVILLLSLILFIPKDKVRVAWVAFLFKQSITWSIGLLVVEFGLIEYPIHEFTIANQTSFTFEFFAYPALCAFFNVFYPSHQSCGKQIRHYILYSSAITGFEVILEKYTLLIHYIHWNWYWSWLTLTVTFFLSRIYCRWFFREKLHKPTSPE